MPTRVIAGRSEVVEAVRVVVPRQRNRLRILSGQGVHSPTWDWLQKQKRGPFCSALCCEGPNGITLRRHETTHRPRLTR